MLEGRTLGFAVAGELRFAMAAEIVEEVAYGPFLLNALPQSCPYLIGAVSLRGQAIPVLDLNRIMDRREGDESGLSEIDRIVVLARDGKRFAIKVDDAEDVRRVDSCQITELKQDAGDCRFTEIHTCPDSGAVSTLLNADFFDSLDGFHKLESRRMTQSGSLAEARSIESAHVVFSCRKMLFAIRASSVYLIENEPDVLDSKIRTESMLGFHDCRGQMLAFLDLFSYLGLGQNDGSSEKRPVILVGDRKRSVGFRVDEILEIKHLSESDLQVFDGYGYSRPGFFKNSIVDEQGRLVIVLDDRELLESAHSDGCFSQIDFAEGEAENDSDKGEAKPAHYLVYEDSRCLFGTLLSDLEAVIEVPERFYPSHSSSSGLIGMCSHLGKTVKVFSLRKLLGLLPSEDDVEQLLLIVATQRGLVGFAVSHVRFLQWAVPTRLPSSSHAKTTFLGSERSMIRVDREGCESSAGVLELGRIASNLIMQEASDHASIQLVC